MNTNLRMGNLLVILLAGGGLLACTTQAANSGTGGTTGATGGSGGTSASGGTTGSGGSGGAYPAVEGVNCLPPATSGLITDFTYMPGDAAMPDMTQVHFGDDSTTLSGGEFVYPAPSASADAGVTMYALTSNVTGNNWHITGTVGNYSGFGFYFDNCSRINATGYSGIAFDISGTVMGQTLTFEVDTLNDTIAPSWLNSHGGNVSATSPGACVPPATSTLNQYSQTTCTEPTTMVSVGSTPTTVTVHWTDFTNGKTDPAPKATDIVGIRWVLPTPTGAGSANPTTYPLDLTIDNIKFVP